MLNFFPQHHKDHHHTVDFSCEVLKQVQHDQVREYV